MNRIPPNDIINFDVSVIGKQSPIITIMSDK